MLDSIRVLICHQPAYVCCEHSDSCISYVYGMDSRSPFHTVLTPLPLYNANTVQDVWSNIFHHTEYDECSPVPAMAGEQNASPTPAENSRNAVLQTHQEASTFPDVGGCRLGVFRWTNIVPAYVRTRVAALPTTFRGCP